MVQTQHAGKPETKNVLSQNRSISVPQECRRQSISVLLCGKSTVSRPRQNAAKPTESGADTYGATAHVPSTPQPTRSSRSSPQPPTSGATTNLRLDYLYHTHRVALRARRAGASPLGSNRRGGTPRRQLPPSLDGLPALCACRERSSSPLACAIAGASGPTQTPKAYK